MEVKYEDVERICEDEVKKNTKNKRQIYRFERFKVENLTEICDCLASNKYVQGEIQYLFDTKTQVQGGDVLVRERQGSKSLSNEIRTHAEVREVFRWQECRSVTKKSLINLLVKDF